MDLGSWDAFDHATIPVAGALVVGSEHDPDSYLGRGPASARSERSGALGRRAAGGAVSSAVRRQGLILGAQPRDLRLLIGARGVVGGHGPLEVEPDVL